MIFSRQNKWHKCTPDILIIKLFTFSCIIRSKECCLSVRKNINTKRHVIVKVYFCFILVTASPSSKNYCVIRRDMNGEYKMTCD